MQCDNTNVMVEFAIVGTEFDPDAVTQRLAIEPTSTWKRGDEIPQRPGASRPPRKRIDTVWEISTGYEESSDVHIQVAKILRRIVGKEHELVMIKQETRSEMFLGIVINVENSIAPAIAMTPDEVRLLAEIGADISFDLYV